MSTPVVKRVFSSDSTMVEKQLERKKLTSVELEQRRKAYFDARINAILKSRFTEPEKK